MTPQIGKKAPNPIFNKEATSSPQKTILAKRR